MQIAIRKEPYGFYIDKTALTRFSREELSLPPYNFTFVNVDDKYADCEGQDFNEDFTFNVEKYNKRKQSYLDEGRMFKIQARLSKLSQDFIQAMAGAYFEDLEARKAEFQSLHNELRQLEGKEPRPYGLPVVEENPEVIE